jgi:hypothetical protein
MRRTAPHLETNALTAGVKGRAQHATALTGSTVSSVLLSRLSEAGCQIRSCGNGHSGFCPAHPDTNRSLSARLTSDGRLLLFCFAGCSYWDILAATGLTREDVNRPATGSRRHRRQPSRCCVACPVARAGGSRCTFHGTDFGAFRRLREVLTGSDR